MRRFRDEHPDTVVTTLRTAATLGPTIRNFATRFFARPVAPTLMGYDPLMQFVHERDVVDAFALAVDDDFPGEFNIVGDGVLPYSTILAMMGKVPLPMPHFVAYPLSQRAVGDADLRLAAQLPRLPALPLRRRRRQGAGA